MQDLENKIKDWYKNLKEPKISFERKGIRPTKDWNKIVLLTFIILCILGVMAFYFYTGVSNGTFFEVDEEELTSEVKVNNALLKKIIDSLEERESNLLQIREGRQAPANPSL